MTRTKDLVILAQLRQDGRMPLTEMSKKTRIPVSTIFDRLKANDLIVRHTTLLDFSKLGYHTRAQIALKVDREDKDALKEHLLKNAAVNSLYRINNGYDYMIEVVVREVKDLEEFLDRLKQRFNVQDEKVYYIIEDLSREAFLSDPELI